MRCPNCGMDIVIATHLCPHCGYAHDFDGAIEKRRDIPEPWELTPDRARARSLSLGRQPRRGRDRSPGKQTGPGA